MNVLPGSPGRRAVPAAAEEEVVVVVGAAEAEGTEVQAKVVVTGVKNKETAPASGRSDPPTPSDNLQGKINLFTQFASRNLRGGPKSASEQAETDSEKAARDEGNKHSGLKSAEDRAATRTVAGPVANDYTSEGFIASPTVPNFLHSSGRSTFKSVPFDPRPPRASVQAPPSGETSAQKLGPLVMKKPDGATLKRAIERAEQAIERTKGRDRNKDGVDGHTPRSSDDRVSKASGASAPGIAQKSKLSRASSLSTLPSVSSTELFVAQLTSLREIRNQREQFLTTEIPNLECRETALKELLANVAEGDQAHSDLGTQLTEVQAQLKSSKKEKFDLGHQRDPVQRALDSLSRRPGEAADLSMRTVFRTVKLGTILPCDYLGPNVETTFSGIQMNRVNNVQKLILETKDLKLESANYLKHMRITGISVYIAKVIRESPFNATNGLMKAYLSAKADLESTINRRLEATNQARDLLKSQNDTFGKSKYSVAKSAAHKQITLALQRDIHAYGLETSNLEVLLDSLVVDFSKAQIERSKQTINVLEESRAAFLRRTNPKEQIDRTNKELMLPQIEAMIPQYLNRIQVSQQLIKESEKNLEKIDAKMQGIKSTIERIDNDKEELDKKQTQIKVLISKCGNGDISAERRDKEIADLFIDGKLLTVTISSTTSVSESEPAESLSLEFYQTQAYDENDDIGEGEGEEEDGAVGGTEY